MKKPEYCEKLKEYENKQKELNQLYDSKNANIKEEEIRKLVKEIESKFEKSNDGIIHIKSSFCTPEIGSMSIINKICHEYDVPVMFFSFDANTSRVGLQTRLEAFNDMIKIRKK